MENLYEAAADFEATKFFILHKFTIDNNYSFLVHYHNSLEMINIIDGVGEITADGNSYYVKKGDTVIINSKQIHHIGTPDTLTYRCAIINSSFFKKYGFSYKENRFFNKITNTKINSYFKEIYQEANNTEKYKDEKIEALMLLMVLELFRNFVDSENSYNSNQSRKSKLAMEAIDYINENYTQNINLNELSKEIGYSKYYLCRTFKEITSQNLVEYANRLRCKKAKEDLQKGTYTVSEISEKYGFDNYPYFSETFKKYMGHSPSFYLKNEN